MKKWDVFISHAREDSEAVARPLAECLQRAGLKVWLDDQQITIGDSLMETIEQGLIQSRFGVVIVSRPFLEKRWPKAELHALMAAEESGRKVILPVWHRITSAELASLAPILADRFAANTNMGLTEVAQAIVKVVMSPASGSSSTESPSVARLFLELLERNSPSMEIIEFLRFHPSLLGLQATTFGIGRPQIIYEPEGPGGPPFAVKRLLITSGESHIAHLHFADVCGPLLDRLGLLSADVQTLVDSLFQRLRLPKQISSIMMLVNYSGTIFARRRDSLTDAERTFLKGRSWTRSTTDADCVAPIDIRTYDSLLELVLGNEAI